MKRQIIHIDEEKCDGCGLCVPECHEGAIRIIEGKARLISDLFCDGLGACIGHCPQDAIKIEEREAEPYDEIKVMEKLFKGPESVMIAHLKHLKDHQAIDYFSQGINFLKERGIENPFKKEIAVEHEHSSGSACGCPGSKMMELTPDPETSPGDNSGPLPSQLAQWPVQIHLVSPAAPYFKNKELVIMSTCGPLASANIHKEYLQGRSVVVGCPKLDYTEPYAEKLAAIYAESNTPKVIVVIMEVPCCGGMAQMAQDALRMSGREDLELEIHVMGIKGKIINIKKVA